MGLAAHIAARVAASLPPEAPLCVGFSGGLDSVVLLDLLHRHARTGARSVSAVHVHHGLSPNADQWAEFCARFCAERAIALAVERVNVDRQSPDGLEAAARAARYAVFAARREPIVALAHHLDDQAETVVLQLLRGTGLKGIAAMPELRALPGGACRLFRPLLAIARAELAAYAQARRLEWIEDESNASLGHDRNYLRHQVAPLLDARFPGWRVAVERFSRHAASAENLLGELAGIDGVHQAGDALRIANLASEERRANALRAFLAVNGVAMPSEARLAEMARQLFDARRDARVRIEHDGIRLVRHRDAIHLDRDLGAHDAWRVDWHGESDVELGAGRGCVHFEPATGDGLSAAALRMPDWYFMPRAGGERIRLDPARPRRTLKNLLQERAIPAWDREKLPLLFNDDRLVWVPGVGIDAEYACAAGDPGFRPCWRVAGRAPLC